MWNLFSCSMWAFSCGMQDLLPCPRTEPRPSAPTFGAWNLDYWIPGKSLALLLQWKSRAKAPIGRISSKCTKEASVIFLSFSQPTFSGGVIFLILALPVNNKKDQPAVLRFYFLATTDAKDLMTKISSRKSLTGSVSITDPSLYQLL